MRSIVKYLIILCYRRSHNFDLINEDLEHWKEVLLLDGDAESLIKKLLIEKPEFRNLLYYRLGGIRFFSRIFNLFYPPLPTLYIWTPKIGGGLFIQHGFATVIAAKEIGHHCFINQQVTIGYQGVLAPILKDNVTVTCGAKVIGGITVGNNSVIGANAVVVKDVPENATVVGVPAYIIKLNGKRCDEKL